MSESSKVRDMLVLLGKQITQSISDGDFPRLAIPDRSTENIVFDSNQGQFILGSSRVIRDSSNTRHVKSFAQLVWVASFAKDLLAASRTSSLRDLYYSSEAFGVKFVDQAESDRIVTDLEALTGQAREDFGVFPEEHSSVYGQVIMRYTVSGYSGREVDLTVSPDGLSIGPALMTAEPIKTSAKLVLAVESGGMFARLIETRAWERFKAVLIHLGGQPPRSTRRLMRLLHQKLGLPVYVFTDGDPWGMHIAQVIITGSANASHISGLSVPQAKWIGVTPDDIKEYSLPCDSMNDADLKRLDELAMDSRYAAPEWQEHIRGFRELRKKAEQQAFSRYGMDYVVDTYLADKLA